MATDAELLHPVVLHHVVNSLQWPGLRPMQEAAVRPLLDGEHALLLAPTAGGKTEAAMFPLLSRMAREDWSGTSVLYVCPLKALLNNLLPRIETYTSWLGRRAALWHGDVTAGRRRRILRERPDVLLTTPESLESMLVSATVDHDEFFRALRTVVVDEVHAFAGDDRGWHLLAVLERLSRVAGRSVQRVGLSATVGNPETLLTWLQGAGRDREPGRVVAPELPPALAGHTGRPPGDVEVDYVGSVHNAAKVLAALHRGEKRLVFCESRALVEELGQRLRSLGVTTFLSHASLSAEERRRAEEAFAQERDCVIVATSTLELGIDVGDLDRVVQIGAPRSVAAFLQRIGRTGRRPGTSRNCLFLTLDGDGLLQAAGLLHLWGRGWVEEVVPPAEPRHIVAQQVLALALQENRIGDRLWRHGWNDLPPFDGNAEVIVRHLVDHGYLDSDSGMLFVGPEAERRFGRRHFMDMLAVFTAPPQFTVMSGRSEIGRTDPALLTAKVQGPRLLLLAGRSWRVTHIDWKRQRCFVEPAESGGKALWMTGGTPAGRSYPMLRAMREVLLGADPPVALTGRAAGRLAGLREEHSALVHPGGTLVVQDRDGEARWWTWAGYRANATLLSTFSELTDPTQRPDDASIRLRAGLSRDELRSGLAATAGRLCLPAVDDNAVNGLKFSAALPHRLAVATLATRLADFPAAEAVLSEPVRVTHLVVPPPAPR
ncbi:DEAD/DEAH box helicase [Micromonospora humi]|uniref:ATP-dependent helicase Lhr and Lhr-like helicase n=1 Tax=Micromonospora humi TaxID=745366 RepID=A0A1C5GMC4_9ACTN|nr:DEAD/DEAH box helicase [Micromonospora humi]SCG34929.1 ATP-dependent helicase Lhr and Lhr-like helicase [Micromonospora humi]